MCPSIDTWFIACCIGTCGEHQADRIFCAPSYEGLVSVTLLI